LAGLHSREISPSVDPHSIVVARAGERSGTLGIAGNDLTLSSVPAPDGSYRRIRWRRV